MDIYNADGSRAEMCGNGIRCLGKYVYDHGMTEKTEFTVETQAGINGSDAFCRMEEWLRYVWIWADRI